MSGVLDIENNVYLQADTEQMSAAVVEIKKLNDNLSQLRQENIMLKVSGTSVHMWTCDMYYYICGCTYMIYLMYSIQTTTKLRNKVDENRNKKFNIFQGPFLVLIGFILYLSAIIACSLQDFFTIFEEIKTL